DLILHHQIPQCCILLDILQHHDVGDQILQRSIFQHRIFQHRTLQHRTLQHQIIRYHTPNPRMPQLYTLLRTFNSTHHTLRRNFLHGHHHCSTPSRIAHKNAEKFRFLGASIASIRCTRPFDKRPRQYDIWGIVFWNHVNPPDVIIKARIITTLTNVHPTKSYLS
ncbi:unnamed protein product, partial [Nesidiocoris tenuis]